MSQITHEEVRNNFHAELSQENTAGPALVRRTDPAAVANLRARPERGGGGVGPKNGECRTEDAHAPQGGIRAETSEP